MQSILLVGAGILIGGGLGYSYWKFVGCRSGMCLITSNKYISTLYGAFTGLLFATQF